MVDDLLASWNPSDAEAKIIRRVAGVGPPSTPTWNRRGRRVAGVTPPPARTAGDVGGRGRPVVDSDLGAGASRRTASPRSSTADPGRPPDRRGESRDGGAGFTLSPRRPHRFVRGGLLQQF